MNNFLKQNKMKRTFTLLLVSLFFVQIANAQSLLERADTAFARKEYTVAIDLYENALKRMKDIDVALINYRIAESYRLGNNFSAALPYYDKAIKGGYAEPEAVFNFAEVLMLSGDYNAAKNYYEQYQIIEPDDKIAEARIKSINLATSKPKDPPIHGVKNIKELNTKYSEFGVAKFQDKIIFASSRMDRRSRVYTVTGQGFSNFYESSYNKEKGTWEAPVLAKGGINSNFNDGTFYYDSKTNTAFFMQCNGLQGKDENCNIFTSTYNSATGTWSDAVIFEYNNEQFNIGHPAMTSDGNTLFFVSDMPGGKGGSDIWMMKRSPATKIWGRPENLGNTINTRGNEMFPYVFEDKYLYFASDGHVGFGGLDIYYVKILENGFSEPVNLMPPFNSSADDFGIIFFDENNGLFSSNRKGGVGDDDIYGFYLLPVTITASGTVIDRENKVNIPSATVTLKGSDGSEETTLSDKNGNFIFKTLKQNIDYSIQASKDRFLTSEEKRFSTKGIKYDRDLNKAQGVDLDLSMIAITKDEIDIPNIYYDYNSADLRQESKQELTKLVNILKENPKIRIMINSHTDSRGSHTYNLDLSNRRAQSVVDFLVQNGISKDRLEAKGHSFTNPRVRNARTEEEHQANRRTTFNILNVEDF